MWVEINSFVIGYDAMVPDAGNAFAPVHVVIPSFHRPQLLRDTTGQVPANVYSDPATKTRVLRPHKEHLAVAADGTVTTVKRFIQDATDAGTEGMTNGPFPFPGEPGGPALSQEGVWINVANAANI